MFFSPMPLTTSISSPIGTAFGPSMPWGLCMCTAEYHSISFELIVRASSHSCAKVVFGIPNRCSEFVVRRCCSDAVAMSHSTLSLPGTLPSASYTRCFKSKGTFVYSVCCKKRSSSCMHCYHLCVVCCLSLCISGRLKTFLNPRVGATCGI